MKLLILPKLLTLSLLGLITPWALFFLRKEKNKGFIFLAIWIIFFIIAWKLWFGVGAIGIALLGILAVTRTHLPLGR